MATCEEQARTGRSGVYDVTVTGAEGRKVSLMRGLSRRLKDQNSHEEDRNACQALAVTRDLGLPDDAEHVTPNGGAIALRHHLGMFGARLALTAGHSLRVHQGRFFLCTMCFCVGQCIALAMERLLGEGDGRFISGTTRSGADRNRVARRNWRLAA